jgi:rhodanese-related sulfurtransferase
MESDAAWQVSHDAANEGPALSIEKSTVMTIPSVTPSQIRTALLLREEIALLDLRHEAAFATGHPLFAANMAAGRIELEAAHRLPRKDVSIVLYDAGEDLVAQAADRFKALGYTNIRQLHGGLEGWRQAGFEIFEDVNSYAKAFGELVEHRRHTPSLAADEVAALIETKANIQILDVRRFDEYATMNIPGSISVPGAELVLRAGRAAPDPETTIVVNCAGRTRSIIGTQSLINAGVANKVVALRNGTIGWTLANQKLDHGSDQRGEIGAFKGAEVNARNVAYRAGVRHIGVEAMAALQAQAYRTLYRFDVRDEVEHTAGHLKGFRHYPGGQLVQEIDMAAPARGARIVVTDDRSVRADMTASWLAQMGWDVFVLDGGYDGALEVGPPLALPKPDPSHRYRRPYEGTDVNTKAMQAYLDWEYGLVDQLRRDATHGFYVI